MKSVKNGLINYLSFIRTYEMNQNSFNMKLSKVVGTKEYNFYGLQDLGLLNDCNEFIVLPIDLATTSIEGGEYYITISGENGEYARYICNVIDHEYITSTNQNSLFSDTVKISNL
jgi:hypothetical protein